MENMYEISGMTCPKCARKIEQSLLPLAGVVYVDFTARRLHITDATVNHKGLQAALEQAGNYKLSEIEAGAQQTAQGATQAEQQGWRAYQPLMVLYGYVAVIACVVAVAFGAEYWMRCFMAGTFIAFSFFKMLDVRAFAASYAGYDLLAQRVPTYGLAYPFIEFGIGLGFIALGMKPALLIFSAVIMALGLAGILLSLKRKTAVRCACLGALLNVPVGSVTIFENSLMLLMALAMLLM